MSTYSPILTKSFPTTAVAIEGCLIVAATGDGKKVELANAATDLLIGAAGELGAPAGGLVDVDVVGIGQVRFGGNIETGEPLTSDANGRAVKAVPVAGQIVRIIGFAHCEAVNGDIGPYHIAPGVLATPAGG